MAVLSTPAPPSSQQEPFEAGRVRRASVVTATTSSTSQARQHFKVDDKVSRNEMSHCPTLLSSIYSFHNEKFYFEFYFKWKL
jgi:hypothetical protein